MKTPYQEMREKAAETIEKQRLAAEARAKAYRKQLAEEAVAKTKKADVTVAQSKVREVRQSTVINRPVYDDDIATDVALLNMLVLDTATVEQSSRDEVTTSYATEVTSSSSSESSSSSSSSYSSSSDSGSSSSSDSSSSSSDSSSSSSSDSSW